MTSPVPGSDGVEGVEFALEGVQYGRLQVPRGRIRSSQRGIHQARRPAMAIAAGTSTIRTTVASMAIATASPIPKRLTTRWSLSTKVRKTTTMIAAAAVITRAVFARPSATPPGVAVLQVLLADPRDQEDLVVHREPEEDREHHHRHERRDRHLVVDPDQFAEAAALGDQGHHAVGRADREQVHDRGLERDQRRVEGDQQEQNAQSDDESDEEGQALLQSIGQVLAVAVSPPT